MRRALLLLGMIFWVRVSLADFASQNMVDHLCDVLGTLSGDVMPPRRNLSGPLPHQQLPKEFRHIIRELSAAHEDFLTGKRPQDITQENHRIFAGKVCQYLASRGIKASAVEMREKTGYFIRLEGSLSQIPKEAMRANHLIDALQDVNESHPDAHVGFHTEKLLNGVSGRPGQAMYRPGLKATVLSIEELLGDRLFPNGKHELGHFHRDVDPDSHPKFQVQNPEWRESDVAGSAQSPYRQQFSADEVSTTYPISFKDNMELAKDFLAKSERVGDEVPEIRDALKAEAYRYFDRGMFEARVSSELFRVTNNRMQPILDGLSKDYIVEIIPGDPSKGLNDRVLKRASDNAPLFHFRSDQMKRWVSGAYQKPMTPGSEVWTTQPSMIREALRGEQKTMFDQLGYMRDTITDMLKIPEFADHWDETRRPVPSNN